MITFLTSSSYTQTAQSLDSRRLTNQLGEARFIMQLLAYDFESRWRTHPVLDLWRDNELDLMVYGHCIQDEMIQRGFRRSENLVKMRDAFHDIKHPGTERPAWFGDHRIYLTHKAMLYKKRPDLYAEFGRYADFYDKNRDKVLCCPKLTHRGSRNTGPCQYFWPSHAMMK